MEELLSSPLGVLVIASSIIEVSGIPPNAPFYDHVGRYPAEYITSCFRELSSRVPRADYFAQLSAERLSELVVQCEEDLHPYTDEYPYTAGILVASGAALRPFVAPLLGAPGTATWFADLDRDRQEWVSRTAMTPQATLFHPDLHSYGAGNTKPRHVLWTSTSVSACTSSWLQYLRISGEVGDVQPPYRRWRLDIAPSARVYEVHGPQAWHGLCLRYPAPSCMAYPTCRPDALIEPDWQAVSRDWDGIHLSVGGFLTAERVRWGMPEKQTHLYGWSVESTAWLRWVFGSAEHLLDGS